MRGGQSVSIMPVCGLTFPFPFPPPVPDSGDKLVYRLSEQAGNAALLCFRFHPYLFHLIGSGGEAQGAIKHPGSVSLALFRGFLFSHNPDYLIVVSVSLQIVTHIYLPLDKPPF